MIHLLLTFTLFASSHLSAQVKPTGKESNSPPWEINGCPINSLCSKKTGERREKWQNILTKTTPKAKKNGQLKKFLESDGIPLKIWATKDLTKDLPLILWDSPCRQHQASRPSPYHAELFVRKKLPKLPAGLFYEKAFSLENDKSIKTYVVPRGELPLTRTKSGGLLYIREGKGSFVSYSIDHANNVRIAEKKRDWNQAEEVVCPKMLVDKHQGQELAYLTLFSEFYCYKIWDMKKKNYFSMIFSFACP